jgi:hypothetical protein
VREPIETAYASGSSRQIAVCRVDGDRNGDLVNAILLGSRLRSGQPAHLCRSEVAEAAEGGWGLAGTAFGRAAFATLAEAAKRSR